jgi:hypothetical protein
MEALLLFLQVTIIGLLAGPLSQHHHHTLMGPTWFNPNPCCHLSHLVPGISRPHRLLHDSIINRNTKQELVG